MKQWWEMREPREQMLLGLLGGLIGMFLIVFTIILPVQSAQADAEAELARAQSDLALVNRLAPRLGSGQADATRPFSRSVLIQTAQAQGIRIARVQPGESGDVAVWVDDIQTQRLYSWLEDMTGNYRVSLDRIVISTNRTGGLSAQFTLQSL